MAFARPTKKRNGPGLQPVRGGTPVAATPTDENHLRAAPVGTVVALLGLAVTLLTLSGETGSALARHAAIGVGVSIAATVLIDLRRGFDQVVRADIMALAALYFLTLFEFLFPQPLYDLLAGREPTRGAIYAVLVGFAGLLTGRHLIKKDRRQPLAHLLTSQIPPATIVSLFWFCVCLGFLHQLVSVNFDFSEWILWMFEPRFSQPWTRGRLGDWKALLTELMLLVYLAPPIAGIIIARRDSYPRHYVISVTLGFLFILFYGFTSGTRNVFVSFLITFLIGYAFALHGKRKKELLAVSAICAGLVLVSTVMMLQFRQIGLRNYLQGVRMAEESSEQSLHVDLNLYTIASLVHVFPEKNPYLGLEVPYLAIIRPIPRAIWKNKPEGLSARMEDAVGANEAWTVASSFVGESYMAGGLIAVFIVGGLFGAMSGWWNKLASPANSDFGILIYASGFFAAVISMRSLFVFTTALLPTVAGLIIGSYLVRNMAKQARRLLGRPSYGNQPPQRPRVPPKFRS